ncbi:MAG: Epiglycanin [Candidatus Kaiserbacteria bacterium GW2011_GWA2_52_12]|uniref:Epiglycanin n=1 Tax=Candidatus Kaiserbacteria bacterium GW2011_GWA2_52_12 TaxID=1618671 RepID=A0A0G1ZVM6_9BACT|nr:MAG: Epiglycanin [Candidatus Kaiserbacteria bacterium GW2011_GWA2_52_12]
MTKIQNIFGTVCIGIVFALVAFPHILFASSCPTLGRTLARTSTGTDVTSLQYFLIDEGDLAAGNTIGYFGLLTEMAVRNWQCHHAVVCTGTPSSTGWGVVGQMTRSAIASSCSSQLPQTLSLAVTGIPSNTLFTGQIATWIVQANGAATAPVSFSAQWGDGQSTAGQASNSLSHTYQTAGSFTPVFTVTTPGGTASVAAPTVSVTSSVASLTASPRSGASPLTVSFSWSSSDGSTLNFGDGTTASISSSGSQSHTYASAGTYNAVLSSAAGTGLAAASISITTTSLSVSPQSGEVPLTVTFTGNGAGVGYFGGAKISFGDGTTTIFCAPGVACSSKTMNYTYSAVGSYTATLFGIGEGSTTTLATTALTVSPAVSSAPCVALSHTLTLGDTDATKNGEVTMLQTFLAGYPSIYPEGWVTGNYGPLTASAVQRFAARYGTPIRCDSHGFSASPMSGPSPLTVIFTAQNIDESYKLDFNDGTQVSTSFTCATAGTCTGSATHTFAAAGSYTAKLGKLIDATHAKTIGIIHLSVATSTPTFTATPTSGAAPLAVSFTTNQISGTIDFGDGSTHAAVEGACTNSVPPSCASSASHTYTASSTYTAKLYDTADLNRYNACRSATPPCMRPAPVPLATATITVSGASCSALTHDLERGDTDAETAGEVSVLQAFLKSQGASIYPEGLITGTFGRLTERAVRRFQTAHSISSTGFVGPLTRAAIRAICTGGTPSTTRYSFTAAPTNGTAPLSVTFTGTAIETLETGIVYVVDFGDGARGEMSEDSESRLTVSHSYQTGGTMTARLLQSQYLCGVGVTSYGCVRELQVDAATVTVSAPPVDVCPNIEGLQTVVPSGMTTDGSGNCVFNQPAPAPPPVGGGGTQTASFSASPTSGTSPLAVTFTYTVPSSDGAGAIFFGDGSSYNLAIGTGSITHTYTAPYNALFIFISTLQAGGKDLGTVNITIPQ